MRPCLALVFVSLACGVSLAQECTLENARYGQPKSSWTLNFGPLPQAARANQIAAFALNLPNSDKVLEGAIHVPNGYGAAIWTALGSCGPGSKALCDWPSEEMPPAVYGIYDGAAGFLQAEIGAQAPEQILLPQLVLNLWYSNYRETEWSDDSDPSDAFVLAGCD